MLKKLDTITKAGSIILPTLIWGRLTSFFEWLEALARGAVG